MVMTDKKAKADVTPVRQRTQYTCMSTSLMMCLQALGHKVTEDEVNDVMGARPKKGAAWENALAAAQHYGCRATLVTPSTVQQLKDWTDAGIPVMIAWNPEGRPWSHASVVFDVDDDLNVYVADPNIPDPDETVRIVPKAEFYSKWSEKWPDYIVRRPAMAVEREITPEGRQVMASAKTAKKILNNSSKAYLSLVGDSGGSLDPSKPSRIPDPWSTRGSGTINEAYSWNWLAWNGWLEATPAPEGERSREFPDWVELTSKGKAALREIRKEQAAAKKESKASKNIRSLVDKLARKYPEAELSFGYLGNYGMGGRDDTSWYVFSKLSKPGSGGHGSYKWGGYRGADPEGMQKMWAWVSSNLEKGVAKAVAENDGPYKGPAPYRGATQQQPLMTMPDYGMSMEERWERGFQANDTDSGAGSDEDMFFKAPDKREVLEFARSKAISNSMDVAIDHAKELDIPLLEELADVAVSPPLPTEIALEPGGKALSTLNRYVVKTEDPAAAPAVKMNQDRMAFWQAELEQK